MDRFSRLCLWGSTACAFLSLALLSFDVFPWYEVPFMPPRPMYPLACAGMLLFLLSGLWYGRMRDHRGLLLLWAALIGCSVLRPGWDFRRYRTPSLPLFGWGWHAGSSYPSASCSGGP